MLVVCIPAATRPTPLTLPPPRLRRPGPHCAPRGRTPLLRQCEARPDAAHQDARVCSASRTVRVHGRRHHTRVRDIIDVSCRSSKQLVQPAAQSVPPAKLATLQSQIALTSHKDDASSGSSPRSEGTCPPCRATAFYSNVGRHASVFRLPGASGGPPSRTQTWISATGWGGANLNAATVGTMGKPPPGRDPKSRARSRDFLKQYVSSNDA